MTASPERSAFANETLTPLVRQLASQMRATRSGSAVVKIFPQREANARPALRGTLDTIAQALELRRSLRERIAEQEQDLEEREARIAALEAGLSQAAEHLAAARDETRRERARADDFERRSSELIDKTQHILTDAGERLADAEERAESAAGDLTYLKDFIQDRLGLRDE